MKTNPISLVLWTRLGASFAASLGFVGEIVAADMVQLTPRHHTERVLAPTQPADDAHYLAFPSILDLGDRVLVSFKRGHAHAADPGAGLDLLTIDKVTDRVMPGPIIAKLDDKIMQMGQWVKFPNGEIGNYIDAQQGGDARGRIGMRFIRSADGGRTFGPLQRLGTVDGVEYGYPFEFVVEGTTTWMMAMTFSNLAGGKSVTPLRPAAGSVDMLRSEDSGRTWQFVRNLTHEFGDIPINESSFVRYADGWLVVTRGYDNAARLHLTDNAFNIRRQANLTETYGFIEKYIGRPRVFMRGGRYYVIGRNWTDDTKVAAQAPAYVGPNFPAAMKMCLFRVDPATLQVDAYSILDNAEAANVTDGYYPVPYFREADGKTWLRVVDYKAIDGRPPQLVEFEYLWDEVR